MKKLMLIAVVTLLLFACNREKETFPESFPIGAEKSVKVGDEYLSDVQSLKFKITEMQDSRCPSDVVCIWQGEALVTIDVESPVEGKLTLSTFDNQLDTLGNFSFELVEVLPYPVSTKIIKLEEYEIRLKIENVAN
jgi:hypothetical protein